MIIVSQWFNFVKIHTHTYYYKNVARIRILLWLYGGIPRKKTTTFFNKPVYKKNIYMHNPLGHHANYSIPFWSMNHDISRHLAYLRYFITNVLITTNLVRMWDYSIFLSLKINSIHFFPRYPLVRLRFIFIIILQCCVLLHFPWELLEMARRFF